MPRLRRPSGAVAVGLAALPRAAAAIQSDRLGAYPTGTAGSARPWFQYHLAAGQTQLASITVENRSLAPMDLVLYPADAAPNGDGGFGMTPQGAHLTDAGGWIHLETDSLHLEPHATKEVGFRFTVPQSASVGPHYGGIIVQPTQSTSVIAGTGVHIISRLGVRLYENLPGAARPGLEVQAFTHHLNARRLSFGLELHNPGNTLVAPTGTITVTDAFSRHGSTFRVNIGTTLRPGHDITTTIPTQSVPGSIPHYHTATAVLSYDPTNPTHTTSCTIHFWTGDILLWGCTTVGLVLTVLMAASYRTYRRAKSPHN